MTGQQAYELDLAARPYYDDGTPRKAWGSLGPVEKQSWIRNPTPRFRTELTPTGEQTVIPGCESNLAETKQQLDLFG